MSQELAGAMQNVPGLLDDIAQIWSGKHYRVPSAHMADARSFRAEIVVFSSLAIQRILFMQNFESSFNDAATMKFINAVGGPKEVATIYLRGLDEIFQGKAFLQEFLLKPVSSRSTESPSSHLLGLLPFILILRPISNVLYQESIVPKIVDHISTLIDMVSPGSEVDMVAFFKSLTFALFLSGAESKHQLIDALADESNGQGGLLGLLWRTKFDETKEFCRNTLLLLFKGLCNHLFWVQTITPSLEAITLVERGIRGEDSGDCGNELAEAPLDSLCGASEGIC
ncbi:hypothetical protein BT96DRAFT_410799 [Gymnopus androsaceus JB14]|uniref:Uncharacterized protein n=1 Tax=Gymnopus androsaceus JB14 TaxID=1447944 RepID=A0A6A4I796_9AGAR|nr:hypothetical protein BT96DRAFT_410799 [Gymnopus androsaceus JB14]